MDTRRMLWLVLPRPVRRFPADLAVVAGLVVLTGVAVFVPTVSGTPLRVVVGVPFVLFLPGYAVTAALFPERGGSQSTTKTLDESFLSRPDGGVDVLQRIVLSLGLSIALVPLLGLVVNFSSWDVGVMSMFAAVSIVTLAATGIAAARRWTLAPADRFSVPVERWAEAARVELLTADSRAERTMNALLVLSVLVAVGSVAYVGATYSYGESYTEFSLLTENSSESLVATDYPSEFVRGEGKPLVVGVGNHEGDQTAYTVVVELQRFEGNGNGSRAVESQELDRFQVTLDDGETWHHRHTVTPTVTGDQLRLQYLLYQGQAPANPDRSGAYKRVHVWVNVTENGTATRSGAIGSIPAREADDQSVVTV